jgi:hypothetical protein
MPISYSPNPSDDLVPLKAGRDTWIDAACEAPKTDGDEITSIAASAFGFLADHKWRRFHVPINVNASRAASPFETALHHEGHTYPPRRPAPLALVDVEGDSRLSLWLRDMFIGFLPAKHRTWVEALNPYGVEFGLSFVSGVGPTPEEIEIRTGWGTTNVLVIVFAFHAAKAANRFLEKRG